MFEDHPLDRLLFDARSTPYMAMYTPGPDLARIGAQLSSLELCAIAPEVSRELIAAAYGGGRLRDLTLRGGAFSVLADVELSTHREGWVLGCMTLAPWGWRDDVALADWPAWCPMRTLRLGFDGCGEANDAVRLELLDAVNGDAPMVRSLREIVIDTDSRARGLIDPTTALGDTAIGLLGGIGDARVMWAETFAELVECASQRGIGVVEGRV